MKEEYKIFTRILSSPDLRNDIIIFQKTLSPYFHTIKEFLHFIVFLISL